jgi:hypothetical protein
MHPVSDTDRAGITNNGLPRSSAGNELPLHATELSGEGREGFPRGLSGPPSRRRQSVQRQEGLRKTRFPGAAESAEAFLARLSEEHGCNRDAARSAFPTGRAAPGKMDGRGPASDDVGLSFRSRAPEALPNEPRVPDIVTRCFDTGQPSQCLSGARGSWVVRNSRNAGTIRSFYRILWAPSTCRSPPLTAIRVLQGDSC